MPNYMLLLYSEPAQSPEEAAKREAEIPLWIEYTQSLEKAGLLIGTDRLQPVDMATTVRVRDGETELTDGPFAVTKEILGGYYMLECADLDEALKQAARAPIARFGSVEVRPIMDLSEVFAQSKAAASQA
jgi:hypothetical protein